MENNIFKYFCVSFCFCLLLNGCNKIAPKEKESFTRKALPETATVVAKVNGYSITLQDLDEEVDRYNAMVPEESPQMKIPTPEQKLNYLKNELVKQILLYKEALDKNLDKDPEIQRALEKTKIQLLVFQLMRDVIAKASVSSSDIEEYYKKLPPEYKKEPEEREIREIVVDNQALAKSLLIRILQGENFSLLARQHSKAQSAKNAGDLGFIKAGTKFREFDAIAFSDVLEKGQVSSVFKGPDGFYIIKLESIKGGKQRSLMDMWEEIKALLTYSSQQKAMDELVGALSRNASIEIKNENVK